jgi:hypothetical protein
LLGGDDGAHAGLLRGLGLQQRFQFQAEAADAFQHRRPFFAQEALAFAGQQFFAGAFSDIHAESPSFFY